MTDQSSGGWFGGFLAAVKQQTESLVEVALSSELAEATKRDLGVFVSTIKEESAKGLAETSASMATKLHTTGAGPTSGVRDEMATLLTSFSHKVGVSSNTAPVGPTPPQPTYTRREMFVHQLQTTPTTFLTEPRNMEDFEAWQSTFDLSSKSNEIAELVQQTRELGTMQANLVPRVVDYDTFWKRYYFQLYEFDKQEEERRELRRKAEEKLLSTAAADDLGWGDDDDVEAVASAPAGDAAKAEGEAGDDSNDDSWLVASGASDNDNSKDEEEVTRPAKMEEAEWADWE